MARYSFRDHKAVNYKKSRRYSQRLRIDGALPRTAGQSSDHDEEDNQEICSSPSSIKGEDILHNFGIASTNPKARDNQEQQPSLEPDSEDPLSLDNIDDPRLKVDRILRSIRSIPEVWRQLTQDDLCNPGLHVAGFGAVGLPLTIRDSQLLFTQYQDRLSSSAIPAVAAFTGSDLTFLNARWKIALAKVFASVKDIVFHGDSYEPLRPTFMLCGPGVDLSHQLRARDNSTPQLLITLPSSQSGAQIHVSFDGQAKMIKLEKGHQFESVITLWHAEATCTVTAPNEGYLAALVYDISPADRTVAAATSHQKNTVDTLRKPLQQCFKGIGSPRMLSYRLTESPVDLDSVVGTLTPADREKVKCLRKACPKGAYTIFVAQLERKVTDEAHLGARIRSHGTGQILNAVKTDDWILKRVENLDGKVVAVDAGFDPSRMIQRNFSYRGKTAAKEGESVRGNNSDLKESSSKHIVVMILSRWYEMDFLIKYGIATMAPAEHAERIRRAREECSQDPSHPQKRSYLFIACRLVLEDMKKRYKDSGILTNEATDAVVDAMVPENTSARGRILKDLAAAMNGYSDNNLKTMVRLVHMAGWELHKWLETAFEREENISLRLNQYRQFLNFVKDVPSLCSQVEPWIMTNMTRAVISRITSGSFEAQQIGDVLVQMQSVTMLDSILRLKESELPVPAIREILESLICARTPSSDQLSGNPANSVNEILSIKSFTSKIIQRIEEGYKAEAQDLQPILTASILNSRTAGDITLLLLNSSALKRKDGIASACLPNLTNLAGHVDKCSDPVTTRILENLTTKLLISFYVHDVGFMPQKNNGISRLRYHCPEGCRDCFDMNEFFKSSQREIFEASGWSTARRNHVEDFIKPLALVEIKHEHVPGTNVVSKLIVLKTDPVFKTRMKSWEASRSRYLDALADIMHLRIGLLEQVTKDHFGMLMSESLKAMHGAAFHIRPETCLSGMRFYLLDYPAGSWTVDVENIVCSAIKDHGGLVLTPGTETRLYPADIAVVAQTPLEQPFVKLILGHGSRVIDRRGLFHLIDTTQQFNTKSAPALPTKPAPPNHIFTKSASRLLPPDIGMGQSQSNEPSNTMSNAVPAKFKTQKTLGSTGMPPSGTKTPIALSGGPFGENSDASWERSNAQVSIQAGALTPKGSSIARPISLSPEQTPQGSSVTEPIKSTGTERAPPQQLSQETTVAQEPNDTQDASPPSRNIPASSAAHAIPAAPTDTPSQQIPKERAKQRSNTPGPVNIPSQQTSKDASTTVTHNIVTSANNSMKHTSNHPVTVKAPTITPSNMSTPTQMPRQTSTPRLNFSSDPNYINLSRPSLSSRQLPSMSPAMGLVHASSFEVSMPPQPMSTPDFMSNTSTPLPSFAPNAQQNSPASAVAYGDPETAQAAFLSTQTMQSPSHQPDGFHMYGFSGPGPAQSSAIDVHGSPHPYAASFFPPYGASGAAFSPPPADARTSSPFATYTPNVMHNPMPPQTVVPTPPPRMSYAPQSYLSNTNNQIFHPQPMSMPPSRNQYQPSYQPQSTPKEFNRSPQPQFTGVKRKADHLPHPLAPEIDMARPNKRTNVSLNPSQTEVPTAMPGGPWENSVQSPRPGILQDSADVSVSEVDLTGL